MSRGPGRIERAIRTLFDAHPHEAFTTDDLCRHCYYPRLFARAEGGGSMDPDRKHRVSVLRAANSIIAAHPDWRSRRTWRDANVVVFYNAASLASTIKSGGDNYSSIIRAPDGSWLAERRDNARQEVAEHVEVRDADPADRPPIEARQKAEHEAWLQRHMAKLGGMLRPPKVLSPPACAAPATHKALAAKARALMTQNDPDAVRAGLAQIADALAAMSPGDAP